MAVASPDDNMLVEKVGSVSGRTRGRITNPKWSGRLIDRTTETSRMFFNCVRIVPEDGEVWTLPGDSGSLVFALHPVDQQRGYGKAAIGLHVGGPDSGRYGIACRIDTVFDALGLATLPEGLLTAVVNDALGDLPPDATPAMRDERVMERSRVAAAMLELADSCRKTGTAGGLLEILDKGRPEIVAILAQDREARSRAARVIRGIFVGHTVDEARAWRIDSELVAAVRSLADALLARATGDVHGAISRVLGRLTAANGKSVGEFLAGDPGRPSAPPRRPPPKR
jgi:hypothetical protein